MDIRELIDRIRYTVKTHSLGRTGEYARWIWQDAKAIRELGLNEYGCADAANILYTIGEFPSESSEREAWISVLSSFQNKDNGLFTESTHHFIHTTAHVAAALELFDRKPLYPMTDLLKYTDKKELYSFLEGLDWSNDPWSQSHRGAGIYAALVLGGHVDREWEDAYFSWLWENADPDSGFWKKGADPKPLAYNAMAGAFHYTFNHEYAKRPLRYPEKMIDSCLSMYDSGEIFRLVPTFGKTTGFIEMDWVYCVNRASRQTSYRFEDCRRVLLEFAKLHIEELYSIDYKTHDRFNDLHMLFGTACVLAELQAALPGEIITDKPLKLVLDRRPFI